VLFAKLPEQTCELLIHAESCLFDQLSFDARTGVARLFARHCAHVFRQRSPSEHAFADTASAADKLHAFVFFTAVTRDKLHAIFLGRARAINCTQFFYGEHAR